MNVKERTPVVKLPLRSDLLRDARTRMDQMDHYPEVERERALAIVSTLLEDGFPQALPYDGDDGLGVFFQTTSKREVNVVIDDDLSCTLWVQNEDGHAEFQVTVAHPEHLEPNDVEMLKAGLRSLLPS